ncbi:MAG: S-adenosylmethionine decarboxylase, partial [Blastocatellia bacterium]|nr:S-adenosylmethionine decarboxylase [Blastocatellia bacterium]
MSTDHPLTISVGSHLILDMLGCSLDLRDKKVLEDLACTIAKEANLTILASHFYQFYPEGVTGTLVLTESHIHLHSWPEYHY